MSRPDPTTPKYTISVAAERAGVHPQTLRDYERKGLLRPGRTAGNTRLYSDEDLVRIRRVKELIAEGLNLSGAEKVVALEEDLEDLQGRYDYLMHELGRINRRAHEGAAGKERAAGDGRPGRGGPAGERR